jgi:hypothetical protein
VYGGLGLDSLTGGADVFNTTLGTSNKDTITDFNVVDDTIHLAKSVMSALTFNQLAENAFWSSPWGPAIAPQTAFCKIKIRACCPMMRMGTTAGPRLRLRR